MTSCLSESASSAVTSTNRETALPPPQAGMTGASIYLGRNAGSRLYHHLRSARQRVIVVSPYVKAHFARELVSLQQRGIDVSLVTSEDVVRRHDVACELVEQHRHSDERARRRRRRSLLLSALLALACFPATTLAPWLPWLIVYPVVAVPLAVFLFLWSCVMRLYSYSYRFRLGRTKILVSPYANGGDRGKEPLMMHAKAYVIDEVAYLGSLNLTTEGFFDNLETCVRIEDARTVRQIVEGLEALLAETRWRTLEAHHLGPALYSEPAQ